MFLGGHHLFLPGELLKSPDYPESGVSRLNHIVDIALLGSLVWIVEQFLVFGFLLFPYLILLSGILYGLYILGI